MEKSKLFKFVCWCCSKAHVHGAVGWSRVIDGGVEGDKEKFVRIEHERLGGLRLTYSLPMRLEFFGPGESLGSFRIQNL